MSDLPINTPENPEHDLTPAPPTLPEETQALLDGAQVVTSADVPPELPEAFTEPLVDGEDVAPTTLDDE